MPLVGYQDWQRVQYTSGFLIQALKQPMPAGYNATIYNVQAWNFLNWEVSIDPAGDTFSLVVAFYQDPLGVTRTSLWTGIFGPGNQGEFSVPILGPYMSFSFAPKTGGNNTNVFVEIFGSMNDYSSFSLNASPVPLVDNSVNLGANASGVIPGNIWYRGAVTVCAIGDGGAGAWIRLHGPKDLVGGDGTWARIAAPVLSAATAVVVSLPPVPISIAVQNGATAQNIFVAIAPHQSS